MYFFDKSNFWLKNLEKKNREESSIYQIKQQLKS